MDHRHIRSCLKLRLSKEETVVVERAHLEGEIEETEAGAEILKRVVGVLVAGDFVQAITKFDGRMDIIIARINSLAILRGRL